MDTKTYNVKLKALKTNPKINCELSAIRGRKKVSALSKKIEVDLESLFLTDDKHNVGMILGGEIKKYTDASFNVKIRATSDLTNLEYTFSRCPNVTQIDVSGIDTSNVISMKYAFSNCDKLKYIDLSSWNTSKVANFNHMFTWCRQLERVDGIIDMASTPRMINQDTIDQFEGMFEINSKNLRGVKLKNVPNNFMENVTIRRGSDTTYPGYRWCGFTSPDQFEIIS